MVSALNIINPGENTALVDIKELIKIRHQCAHPGKKGRIDIQRTEQYTHILSVQMNYYLSSKYGIYFGGGGSSLRGVHTKFSQKKFTTLNPIEDFALDVPSMLELEKSGNMKSADFS